MKRYEALYEELGDVKTQIRQNMNNTMFKLSHKEAVDAKLDEQSNDYK